MDTIEVFADVRCPFTHVGLRRLVARRDEAGGGPTLVVRSWPLELVNGEPLDPAMIGEEVGAIRAQVAPDLFQGFSEGSFSATSLPALELTAAAYDHHGPEVGEAVALDLRWALFEEGRDVADPAVLAELAGRHGVEVPGVDPARTRQDWERGRALGVVGSPHFLVGSESFFCPGLDIHHGDDGFAIRPDAATFDRFVALALGEDGAGSAR